MASNICAELHRGVSTSSAEETRLLARRLAAALPDDTVLALHGDMGVGKTTFVQGLAEGLGINETVTSPTFNIFTLHVGVARRLLHLDAYRLESENAVDGLMLEDFLVSPWILAVEWPERIASWIPSDSWHLQLGITPDEKHTVRLAPTPAG